MAGKAQIFNRTLVLLELEPVTSDVTKDNKKIRVLNAIWEFLPRELMYKYAWLFTIKQARLPKLDESGIAGFEHVYQTPNLLLATLRPTNEVYNDLKIQGDRIYSKYPELTLNYIQYVDNMDKWTTGFNECLSYELAIEAAGILTGSSAKGKNLLEKYESLVLPRNLAVDAAQEKPEEYPNSLVEAGDEN